MTEQAFAKPVPNAEHPLLLSDGATIVLRRHGQIGRPRLVLSHGNGLAIDGYVAFWSLLCARFEVIVFDMRNHGANPTHSLVNHHFDRFAEDLHEIWSAIDQVFGRAPTVGLFHSMSAVAAAIQLKTFGAACDGLVLFDPPVYPPAGHRLEALELADMNDLARRARRRPEQYDSPDQLAEQFARRKAFSQWVPGSARALAYASLRRTADGALYELACPREYEAKIYETNDHPDPWTVLTSNLALPVLVIGGDPELPGQGPPALLCAAMAQLGGFDYHAIAGTSHFLQIEQPQVCVDTLLSFIQQRIPGFA